MINKIFRIVVLIRHEIIDFIKQMQHFFFFFGLVGKGGVKQDNFH